MNRAFIDSEDWTLADSLNAFSDLLYGGYGQIRGSETVDMICTDIGEARHYRGRELTRKYFLQK